MKKISIVIVTYNSEKDIYDCVKSIRNFVDIPFNEIELIIVDNNSKHSIPMFENIKKEWEGDIVFIQNKNNVGYGQGNNIGIKASSASIILIINPDVRLMEPIFKPAFNAFQANALLGIFGLKQMLTPTIPSNNSFACTYMMNGYVATILSAVCTRMDLYLQKYMHISGACFFLNKEKFQEIGMFDESNFLYGEEDDIHHRFRKAIPNIKMIYDKHLHYIHLTKDREPNLEYEKKLIQVAVKQNKKNGYSPIKTLNNRLANVNIEILREKIRLLFGKGDSKQYKLFKAIKKYLLNEIIKIKQQ